MRLTKTLIKRIEDRLEPGYTCEITVDGDKVSVFKRPVNHQDIDIPPTLACQDEHTQLRLLLVKPGEDPVHLVTQELPPGYWVAGIKGYLSPEVPGEE